MYVCVRGSFFLLGAYYHKPSNYYWIYPAFALWAADRLARLLRVLIINLPSLVSPSSTGRADVQALSDCTLRVSVQRRVHWKPGQHAYLVLPSVSALPWEAHPFTIASLPSASRGRPSELVFLIRARDGFTRRLMSRALRQGGTCTVPALLDGAYGAPPSLSTCETVVLVAGGSGVSYALPLFAAALGGKRGLTRSVLFVWIVRREMHLGWIAAELQALLGAVPEGVDVQVRLYVTHSGLGDISALPADEQEKVPSPTRTGSFATIKSSYSGTAGGVDSSSRGEEVAVAALLGLPQVTLAEGRPDVHVLLKDAVQGASGPVSVGGACPFFTNRKGEVLTAVGGSVCGPAGLSNAVRGVLAQGDVISWGGALRGAPVVELHVETFGW
ncbi:hypothetical protein CALCODRAFT_489256 [Calocera cornea HHB12733]|uniref:ferric-chelate reductase (NADPH) n=1 Tax=Calocera cornea HHB12733 TaxID=1353952 RepID=A0A165K773_9BASI|nr:hypothetical protein CALCODRAFT_489256 [Calocera cornea HHB12733]